MESPTARRNAPRKPMLSTTIIANNIHCSSCVSYIQDVVGRSSLSYAIVCTNVSVLSGEIQILHEPQLPIQVVCREISDAAFEVHCATTVDEQDNIVSEFTFQSTNDGLIEEVAERVRSSLHLSPSSPSAPWNLSTPLRNKRKRHVENCQACQSKQKHDSLTPSTPLSKKLASDDSFEQVSTPPSTVSSANTMVRALKEALESPPESPCDKRGARSARLMSKPLHLSAEISLAGMTCSSCTNAVNDTLLSLDAVNSVQVSLMTNSATVVFQGDKSYEAVLRQAVEDVGFEVNNIRINSQKEPAWLSDIHPAYRSQYLGSGPPKSLDSAVVIDDQERPELYQARFSISGMTCSACANSVTDILTGLPFVQSAIVNLMANSAEVIFESSSNAEAILTAIEDMGFDCALEPDSHRPLKPDTASSDDDELPVGRSLRVKIDGFYCNRCPARVVDQLGDTYGDSLHVDKRPSFDDPVITVSYIPDLANDFTARTIVRKISSIDEQNRFQASIHHPPSVEEKSRQVQRAERRKLLLKLIASTVLVIPTFVIGVVCMSLLPSNNPTRVFFMEPVWAGQVSRAEWALFILATPVFFFVADVFHKRALKEIRALWRPKSRVPILRRFIKFGSMNLLVSAGTTVAYIASLAVLVMGANLPMSSLSSEMANTSSSTYFDMVVFLTFFILIGRYIEAYSKAKAGDAVSMLSSLRPESAIVCEGNGDQFAVPTDQLEIGDHILVRYGESPAADGILVDTEGRFDESSLTGESRPAHKSRGEKVFTGTVNLGAPVKIKVCDITGSSMLDQIITVVREGQVRRAPIEQIADKITGYFVPVITALAILTFVVWISLGYSGALDAKYLGNRQGGWAFWSLEFAIAVFVVACPCGIGLAAPTALFVGGGLAAKHGILARGGGQAFQDAGNLDAIVFDKTGTLTEGGDLKVTDVEYLGSETGEMTVMAIAHKLETASSHPVAGAIAAAAASRIESVTPIVLDVASIEEIAGNGIEGTLRTADGTWTARIGSQRFISALCPSGLDQTHVQQHIASYEQQAKTVALLATRFKPHDTNPEPQPAASSYQLSAIFAVEDAIRPSAAPAVEALARRGLEIYMVSGDNAMTALSVAARVGIKAENVFAGVLPTEKAATIELLRRRLSRKPKRSKQANTSPLRSPLRRVFIDRGKVCEKLRPGRDTSNLDIEAQTHERPIPALQQQLTASSASSSSSSSSSAATIKSPARIAFVGDGINDAPALALADISISPCSASPIALTASQFILMRESLTAIPELLDISTRVFRRVRFNFAWALMYNVVLVPVAAGVFFRVREDGWRLGPVWGSLAMALSSVSVVVSSLLLRWEWKGRWMR